MKEKFHHREITERKEEHENWIMSSSNQIFEICRACRTLWMRGSPMAKWWVNILLMRDEDLITAPTKKGFIICTFFHFLWEDVRNILIIRKMREGKFSFLKRKKFFPPHVQNVKMQWNCSQNAARIHSKCSQNAARMQPKCSQNAVETQPKLKFYAAKIKQNLKTSEIKHKSMLFS